VLVLTIARLTVLEMLRRKLFLVLLGLTVLVIAFTSWGFGQITTIGNRPMTRVEQIAVVSQLLILVGFMFSFTLALSTRLAGMVGGVVALILWGVGWIGGIVGGVGLALNNATAAHVGTATRLILPTDGMWRGAVWALEPEGIIAATRSARAAVESNPFFAADPPDPLYVAWTIAWIAVGLGIAIWSFSRREV